MNLAFFFNSVMLGAGLAMDACSVSMADGLGDPGMSRRRMTIIAGTFAGFQFLMPVLGWFFVRMAASYFRVFETCIPWIALVLLCLIGGGMLRDGVRCRRCAEPAVSRLGARTLFLQGVATSIDALSVGFTIAEYGMDAALTASLIIAAVTFWLCVGGLLIGKRFGTKLAGRALILGGCILIVIGAEIFLSNL